MHMIETNSRPIPPVVKGSEYLTMPRKPWLVSGIIREASLAFLSAKEGTGKSFVALDLAHCIAQGIPFLDNEVSQGDVIYVAAERGDSQRERLEALRDLKQYDIGVVNFIDYAFKFNVPDDEQLFYEAVDRVSAHPKLIVVDTLRASFEGDENSSWNAQATMDAFNRIRKKYNSTILVLHHVNAFGKSRGSSAFIGSADTELYLTESKSKKIQRVYLTVRKQNNGKKYTKYTLDAQEIDFGNDYSSIVFNHSETELSDLSPEDEENTNQREQNVLEVLADAGDMMLSLYAVQNGLKTLEGSLPNRTTLKAELQRMADKHMIIYEKSGNKHQFGLPPTEQD